MAPKMQQGQSQTTPLEEVGGAAWNPEHQMAESELVAQASTLCTGKQVVFCARKKGAANDPWVAYAATLVMNESGDVKAVWSTRNNHIHGVHHHVGNDTMSAFPHGDFEYRWIVSSAVYLGRKGLLDEEKIRELHQKVENMAAERRSQAPPTEYMKPLLEKMAQVLEKQVSTEERRVTGAARPNRGVEKPCEVDDVTEWTPLMEDDVGRLLEEIEKTLVTPYLAFAGGEKLGRLWTGLSGWIGGIASFEVATLLQARGLVDAGNVLWEEFKLAHYAANPATRGLGEDTIRAKVAEADRDVSRMGKAVTALLAAKAKGKKPGDRGPGKDRPKGGRASDTVCHHCGKRGHMKKDCWTLHPELAPGKGH